MAFKYLRCKWHCHDQKGKSWRKTLPFAPSPGYTCLATGVLHLPEAGSLPKESHPKHTTRSRFPVLHPEDQGSPLGGQASVYVREECASYSPLLAHQWERGRKKNTFFQPLLYSVCLSTEHQWVSFIRMIACMFSFEKQLPYPIHSPHRG